MIDLLIHAAVFPVVLVIVALPWTVRLLDALTPDPAPDFAGEGSEEVSRG